MCVHFTLYGIRLLLLYIRCVFRDSSATRKTGCIKTGCIESISFFSRHFSLESSSNGSLKRKRNMFFFAIFYDRMIAWMWAKYIPNIHCSLLSHHHTLTLIWTLLFQSNVCIIFSRMTYHCTHCLHIAHNTQHTESNRIVSVFPFSLARSIFNFQCVALQQMHPNSESKTCRSEALKLHSICIGIAKYEKKRETHCLNVCIWIAYKAVLMWS